MIRYGTTHVLYKGTRALSAPAPYAHFLHDTRAAAEREAKNIETVNSRDTLVSVFGKQALGTFKVLEIDCWDSSGEPKGTVYPDKEEA